MKRFGVVLCILICLLVFGVAGVRGMAEEQVEPQTEFLEHSRSFKKGNVWLDLSFFANEADAGSWMEDSMERVELRVGNSVIPMNVESLEMDGVLRYGKYYRGTLYVEGDVGNEMSGEAYLRVYFEGKEDCTEYPIGQIAVLDAGNDGVITNAVLSGIVAEDREGTVRNYGIMAHVTVTEDVTIIGLDFGFDNLGLCGEKCIVYTPEQYKAGMESAMENDRLTVYVSDDYETHRVERITKETELRLTQGEYYIYFPIVVTGEDIPELDQGVLEIAYVTDDGVRGTFVTNSWPYFTASNRTEAELEKMFQGE